MKICDKGVENLVIGIINQAAQDYKDALLENSIGKYKCSPQKMLTDCKKFFESSYFELLTDVKGEYLMKKIKLQTIEEVINNLSYFESVSHRSSRIVLQVFNSKKNRELQYCLPPKYRHIVDNTIFKIIKHLEEEKEKINKE